jgi:hypothetical protein
MYFPNQSITKLRSGTTKVIKKITRSTLCAAAGFKLPTIKGAMLNSKAKKSEGCSSGWKMTEMKWANMRNEVE